MQPPGCAMELHSPTAPEIQRPNASPATPSSSITLTELLCQRIAHQLPHFLACGTAPTVALAQELPARLWTHILCLAAPWDLRSLPECPEVVWQVHWRRRMDKHRHRAAQLQWLNSPRYSCRGQFWNWVVRDCWLHSWTDGQSTAFANSCESVLGIPFSPGLADSVLEEMGDLASTLVLTGTGPYCWPLQRIIKTFPHIRSLCLSHIRPGPRSLDLVLDVYSHFKNQIQELTILFCNSIPTLLALLQAIAGNPLDSSTIPLHELDHQQSCMGAGWSPGREGKKQEEEEDLHLLYSFSGDEAASFQHLGQQAPLALSSLQIESCALLNQSVEEAVASLMERLSGLQHLNLNSCMLRDPQYIVSQSLASLLPNLRTLQLSDNCLRMDHLEEMMRSSWNFELSIPLHHVDLSNNILGPQCQGDSPQTSPLRLLLCAAPSKTCVFSLLLNRNELFHCVPLLGSLLADPVSSLCCLDLSYNYLSASDLGHLFACLVDNSSLVSLSLDSNHFGETSLLQFSNMLCHNRTLTSLSLRSTGFKSILGWEDVLQTGLEKNSTLQELKLDSNPVDESAALELLRVLHAGAPRRCFPSEGLRSLSLCCCSLEAEPFLEGLSSFRRGHSSFSLDELFLDGSLEVGDHEDLQALAEQIEEMIVACRLARKVSLFCRPPLDSDTSISGRWSTAPVSP